MCLAGPSKADSRFPVFFTEIQVDEEIAIHDSGQRLCAKKGLAVLSFGNGFLLFSLSCARVVTSRRGRKRGRVSIVIVLRGTSRYLMISCSTSRSSQP